MRTKNVAMNCAHLPGPVGAAITNDGFVLVTAGSDTEIRAHDVRGKSETNADPWWIQNPGTEPELPDLPIAEMHETPINAVAIAPDNKTLATGSSDGFVRIFTFSAEETKPSDPKAAGNAELKASADLVVACARFGGPVRALSFSPSGAFLAAAGDEPGLLKIIMTAQPSNVSILKCGEKEKGREAIVDLAFDPKTDFVASVGELGSACVWSVESGNFLARIDLNDRCAKTTTWAPDGGALVVGTDKGAVLVKRGAWVFDALLKDAGDEEEEEDDEGLTDLSKKTCVNALAWADSGRYLLTGAGDARIALWDVDKRAVMNSWKAEAPPQRLFWHPTDNAYIIVDEIGQFGIVSDVVPEHLPGPFDASNRVALPEMPEVQAKRPSRKADAASDSEEEVSIKRSKSAKKKKAKAKTQAGKKSKEEEDEAEEASEDEVGGSGADSDSSGGTAATADFMFAFDAEDLDVDDEEELKDKDGKTGYESDTTDGERDDKEIAAQRRKKQRVRKRAKARMRAKAMFATAKAQPAFMPSSTPLQERTAQRKRILCWNLIGAVLSFDETTHDVVEVEFADATQRTVGIKDHFGYSMGCLNSAGVLLGAPKTDAHGSLIYFRPFSSWSSNSDWQQFMQGDENVAALALGKRFAAVATGPANTLRLFSLSGIQTDVCGVAGPVVTLAAHDDLLAVVFGVPGTKMLRYELLEVSGDGAVSSVLAAGDIVMSAGAKMEWIGFAADSRELAVYDSTGTLFLLTGARAARRWIPMIRDAAKGAGCDWLWVAAATSDTVVGAPCHSNERFPPAKPRPALRSVPLTAPVLNPVNKKGEASVAERMFRSQLRLARARGEKKEVDDGDESDEEEAEMADTKVYKAEVEMDKCILALMEEACKHEQNLRAFDLATRLHTKVSFKYAVDLANYFKRTGLATRVEEIARHKAELLDEEEREKTARGVRVRRQQSYQPVANDVGMESESDEEVTITGGASKQENSGVLEGVSDDEEEGLKNGKRNGGTKGTNGNGQAAGTKRTLADAGEGRSQKAAKGKAGATAGAGARASPVPVKAKKGSFVNRFKK